jgi:DNA-binding MarR family transcriptional regulator
LEKGKLSIDRLSSDLTNDMSSRARVFFTWIAILQLVEEGEHAAAIAKRLNKSRQRVGYHIRKLAKWGYLEPLCSEGKRSYPIFYKLTESGHARLEQLSNMKRTGRFRFHNYMLEYRIVRDNPEFLPLSEGTPLKNGVVQVVGEVDGFSVKRWSSPSGQWLLLCTRPKFGDQPLQLVALSSLELDHLATEICRRYGMDLQFLRVARKPHFGDPSDRFAKFWGENYGCNVMTREGSGIDASPPGHEWEKEMTIDDAVAYVKQARNVENISQKQDEDRELFLQRLNALEKDNVALDQGMNRLTDAMIMNATAAIALTKSIDRLARMLETGRDAQAEI